MTAFLKKHSTLLLLSLLILLLILAWLFPSAGLMLGITFLLVTFLLVSWLTLDKQTSAYRRGQIPRGIFIRNAVVEIGGTWTVMVLAALLGRQAAGLATHQIDNDLLRVMAGILVGLLVGVCIGALAKKTLRRLVEVPPEG